MAKVIFNYLTSYTGKILLVQFKTSAAFLNWSMITKVFNYLASYTGRIWLLTIQNFGQFFELMAKVFNYLNGYTGRIWLLTI